MFKRIILGACVSTLMVSRCPAELVLKIESGGETAIVNVGVTAIDFDAYSIRCVLPSGDGCLTPGDWNSIEDQVNADVLATLNMLGAGGLGFGEANPTTRQIGELTLGPGGVIQPGARVELGHPIESNLSVQALIANGNLSWDYSSPSGGIKTNAPITAVPEPSPVVYLVAVLGLVGVLKNRAGTPPLVCRC